MFHIPAWVRQLFAFVALLSLADAAAACPFCSAVSKTFSEEIDTVDVAVIATLVEAPPSLADDAEDADLAALPPKAKFEATEVVKGENAVAKGSQIEVLYFGDKPVGTQFLILGVEPPAVTWATPIEINDRAKAYIREGLKLPKQGPDRLAFFQGYLEDADEMLTRDAYDEFAKAPYADVKGLKDRMKHDQLVAWLWNPQIPASRKRLYMTMLSVCGNEHDLLMLEIILKSNVREIKAGLDAAIACYLTLKGPDGMPLVEDLYFKNGDAEYTDTYAAIMALRFHAQEGDTIPLERIKTAFRFMLDKPKLADLVIPDLARWEDWWVLERMVTLFKEADSESSWVRVPVINYLRACPLPKAKAYIDELAQIDPDAVKRANSSFPLGAVPVPAAASARPAAPDDKAIAAPATDAPANTQPQNQDSAAPAAKPLSESATAAEKTPMLDARLTATTRSTDSETSVPALVGSADIPPAAPAVGSTRLMLVLVTAGALGFLAVAIWGASRNRAPKGAN